MDAKMALVVLLMLLIPASVSWDSDGASPTLLIRAFDPYGEAIAVSNPGPGTADLFEFSLTDGEGTWAFKESFIIPAGSTVAFSSDPKCESFGGRYHIVVLGEEGFSKGKGSLVLNNTGDEIYLMKDGAVIDAVCYGNKKIDEGDIWSGPPADVKKGYYTLRVGGDTNTAEDWATRRPGVTEVDFDPKITYQAEVTPFLFPDSGGVPIYRALEAAEERVQIALYLLSSKNIFSLLCDLEDRGVDVTLLLEANPLGIDLIAYLPLMKALANHGGEIYLIGGDGERFPYMHAKYAIIDGYRTIILTENWTSDNLNGNVRPCSYGDDTGNRGWGAVIDSADLAFFMEQIFSNDIDMGYGDVRKFVDAYPNARAAGNLVYSSPEGEYGEAFQASVLPFLSPDGSFEAESYYMGISAERVYSQQQSIGSSMRDVAEGSPIWCMAQAASRGVDTRLIICELSAGSYSDELCAETLIKAASMRVPYVHNKGLVCDDVAIVASVNWTDNSFSMNREFGVAIESADVAGFFAEAFLRDHARCYLYEGFTAEITEMKSRYRYGEEAVFSVTMSAIGDYSYEWDLGDGRVRVTSIPRMSFWPSEGEHMMVVTVSDGSGFSCTASAAYSSDKDPSIAGGISGLLDGFGLLPSYFALAAVTIVLAVVYALARHYKQVRGDM